MVFMLSIKRRRWSMGSKQDIVREVFFGGESRILKDQ